jgi:hypothetical protein
MVWTCSAFCMLVPDIQGLRERLFQGNSLLDTARNSSSLVWDCESHKRERESRIYAHTQGPSQRHEMFLGEIQKSRCIGHTEKCLALLRDEDVIDRPDWWLPDRWLNTTEEMKKSSMPFRAGRKSCTGQLLATSESEVFLTRLV